MIMFTETDFRIDGTTDVIIEDVLKVLYAHSKQSEGENKISVPALMEKLNARYEEALKASMDNAWKKMDLNSNYCIYGMTIREGILTDQAGISFRENMYGDLSSAITKTAKAELFYQDTLFKAKMIMHELGIHYHISVEKTADDTVLNITTLMDGGIVLMCEYTKDDLSLAKILVKEINWHFDMISKHDIDYYKNCDAEYLEGYWKDLLVGIKDTLCKLNF